MARRGEEGKAESGNAEKLKRGGRKNFFPTAARTARRGFIPNYVVLWSFDFQQGVLASQEFPFAALRGGRWLPLRA
jgi:hypothetical protein